MLIKNCQRCLIFDNFQIHFSLSFFVVFIGHPPEHPEQPLPEESLSFLINRQKVNATKAIAKKAMNKSIIFIFVHPLNKNSATKACYNANSINDK